MSGEDKSYPVPAADGAQIDKDNGTILTRWQGNVYVYSLACPHQNTGAALVRQGQSVRVPEAPFALPAGRRIRQGQRRATRGLDRFAVRKDGNNVVANLDKMYKQDDNEADWTAAFITI